MSKKKACKKCKYFFGGDTCPLCKNSQSVTNWKGRIHIVDKDNSAIGKKIGASAEGEYAIKVT